MKVEATIDIEQSDKNMDKFSSLEQGLFGCDKQGVYHMWFGYKTYMVEFNKVKELDEVREI